MLIIKVRENEHIDKAIRRYRRKQRNTKLRDEVRKRRYYTKPSKRRKTQIDAAKYKEQKAREE